MRFLLLMISSLLVTEEVPFKASDEFELRVEVSFRVKPSKYSDNSYTTSGERLDRQSGTQKPFLKVTIDKLKVLDDEVRVVFIDNTGKEVLRKKLNPVPTLEYSMGFVDDLKAGTSSPVITAYFISANKEKLRRIVFNVEPSGIFQVNGNWHGQF